MNKYPASSPRNIKAEIKDLLCIAACATLIDVILLFMFVMFG